MNLVERLTARAKAVKTDLDAERVNQLRAKADRERVEMADAAPDYKRDNAYCVTCKADCATIMRKHGNQLLAYYLGTCPAGHRVRRELHLYDTYYDVSPLVKAERHKYADDLLTPNDARFKTIYPDKWRELEAQREQRDLATK